MRVIRGKYQGHRFNVPKNIKARPTTDFAKESLFNILNNDFDFEGLEVLDLFGGTGNISFEFGSRGAKSITLIENDFHHCKFISAQASKWQLPIHVIKGDVFKVVPQINSRFDIIFADPPYDLKGIEKLPELILSQNILKEDGILIIEHGKETDLSDQKSYIKTKTYSRVNFSFFKNDC